MKKKILSGLFASALLIAAATGAMESKKSEAGLSDLAMANVEALATGEGGSSDCATYCTPADGHKCIILWPGAEGITCPRQRPKSS